MAQPVTEPEPEPVTAAGLSGADIIAFTSTGCHSIDVIKTSGYKADQWPGVIDTMIRRGASVAPEDRAVLEAYWLRVLARPIDR